MFGCSFIIFFPRCYICPLIHNILRPLSSPVEIVDSISLPVEVNNSTIELYLPVDLQYSSPLEASSPGFQCAPLLCIPSIRSRDAYEYLPVESAPSTWLYLVFISMWILHCVHLRGFASRDLF